MTCVAQVEIDKWCRRVLAKHWPDVPKFGDIRNVGIGRRHELPPADLICGGFPCQDVSQAGKQKGIKAGTRSGLFFEAARIIGEVQPRWVIIENVRGLLSSNDGRDFETVLRELSRIGYDAEWQTISPSFFDAPQSRYRTFIIANNANAGILWWERREEKVIPNLWSRFREADFQWNRCNYPILRRGDGVSPELDRTLRTNQIRGLGNAVVPQLAEFVGKIIIEKCNE